LSPELVVLGNLLVDDVVFPDGRTRMGEPGGATLYAALGAALWGVSVGLVSIIGDDYPPQTLEALRTRGVELALRRLDGPGLRSWLLYEDHRRQIVLRQDRPSHAAVSPGPAEIPAAWRDAGAFHLAPMPFHVQQTLVADLPRPAGAILSLDPFLILRPDTAEAWRSLVPAVDIFFLSQDEDELGEAAVHAMVGPRSRFVLWKRGARGGHLWDARSGGGIDWAPRAELVIDSTGAGDAFAGGFLAGLLNGDEPERALERGVVSASFAIADYGPAALLAATPDQAAARWREWYAR